MKKIIEKKLTATRKKVSKEWGKYHKEKYKIKKDKSLDFFDKANELKVLIKDTRKNISQDFADYRERKYLIVHAKAEPYFGFKYDRKFETQHTKQEFLKVKNKDIKTYNTEKLDDIILKVFDKKSVTGVGLVLKVEYADTGEIGHVSKFYTRIGIKRILERGRTLYEDLEKKLEGMSTKSSQEFNLRGIYIRIIYEKSTESSK
jgi:hypothetical protein